ncbi:MAG TPA: DNA polymerase IV, partial [Rubrivivax sp.]|nr:DNA polymerase IV [Rubrivivax sp.]
DLQRKGYVGRTIGIKLRFEDFRTVTRDLSLPDPTADAQAIRRAAGECLKRVGLERKLRLLGVRAGTLSKAGSEAAARGPRRTTAPAADVASAGPGSDELPFCLDLQA